MEDEPAAKKAKLTRKPDTKPTRQDPHSSRSGDMSAVGQPQVPTTYQDNVTYQPSVPPVYHSSMEPAVPESQPQVYQEDLNMVAPLTQAPTTITQTVSSVSITRRDPRMARHSSAVTVTYTAPEKSTSISAELFPSPASALVEVAAKAPLPMPPAPPPSVAVSKIAKTR